MEMILNTSIKSSRTNITSIILNKLKVLSLDETINDVSTGLYPPTTHISGSVYTPKGSEKPTVTHEPMSD